MLNKEAFTKIDLEIKKWKGEVMNLFENLENKQKMQMDNVKYVLEHSGSKRLYRLSKRILGKRIELNKAPQVKPKQFETVDKFKKPTEDEIIQAKNEIKRRSTVKKDNKYFYQINEEPENESFSKTEEDQELNYLEKNLDRRVSKNVMNEEEEEPITRKISDLENEIDPGTNSKNKKSYYLKPEDFQSNPQNTMKRNSQHPGSFNKELNQDKNNYKGQNYIPKSSVFSKRNERFFYDMN